MVAHGQLQEASSFFEKKEAKKLHPLDGGCSRDGALEVGGFWLRQLLNQLSGPAAKPRNKVFLLLFVHKKKTLPFAFLPLESR